MRTPPLKRHPALRPFARDHDTGLVQGRHLMRAAVNDQRGRRSAVKAFAQAWEAELAQHLVDEEALRLPLMTMVQQDRLKPEHDHLRRFADESPRLGLDEDPGVARAPEVGLLLDDDIRWEELELFPATGQACTVEQITDIERRTIEFEVRRPRTLCARARRDEERDSPNREE